MYLKRGLQQTFQAIRKHKVIFVLLIVLQLLFLIILSYLIIDYQVKILEDAQEITQAVQNANYNPDSIQAGEPFLKDIFVVYNNYDSMMDNIGQFILWLFFLFILFNGLIWVGAHYLFKKTKVIKEALKFLVSTVVLLGPLLIIFYIILKKYINVLSSSWWILLTLFIIAYYLLLVSFAFLNLKSWKQFVKKIFVVGIKKIHLILLVLITNLVLISLSIALIYVTFNQIYISMITILLFVITLILTRIFWIACLKNIK